MTGYGLMEWRKRKLTSVGRLTKAKWLKQLSVQCREDGFLWRRHSRRLTFDMRGPQKARPFGHPLDGGLERRAPPHTDHEPGTVAMHAVVAGSVAD